MNASLSVPLLFLIALALAGRAAHAASGAWVQDQTSAALQHLEQPVAVRFEARTPEAARGAAGAVITHVHAARTYAGTARVATQLCWGSPAGPCIELQAPQVDTHAFDGRAATGPIWLVYRAVGWGADHPPLYVRGAVTVWYADAGP